MLYSILSNEASTLMKCTKYFKKLRYAYRMKEFSPVIEEKLEKLRYSLGIINNFSIKNSTLSPPIGKIKLNIMEDITEIAELVSEQESVNKKESIVDFDADFSVSENELMEEELDDSISIEKVPNKENYYQHSFNINRNCYKHIVGSKGNVLKKLCTDTKTLIRVSKKKKHVVIIGSVQKRIIRAKHQIVKLIEDSKKEKLRFTHFISIPTNNEEIKDKFLKFKTDVLKNCDLETTEFHADIFQKPEKLHLTICMLHLLDNNDQEKAIEVLNECKKDIIEPIINKSGPLKIEFKGLTFMGNNVSKAKVIYFKVHEKTGSLKKISEAINDYFIKQGLTRKEHDNLTLHLTVMNTVYCKRKKHKKFVKTIDATNIIKSHEETSLGEFDISSFHLSKLTTKSADGYFEAVSKLIF